MLYRLLLLLSFDFNFMLFCLMVLEASSVIPLNASFVNYTDANGQVHKAVPMQA